MPLVALLQSMAPAWRMTWWGTPPATTRGCWWCCFRCGGAVRISMKKIQLSEITGNYFNCFWCLIAPTAWCLCLLVFQKIRPELSLADA